MNVVELEQKKALLVEFSRGKSLDSTFEQIQSNTLETVQVLKSMKGGLPQSSTVEVSPLIRSAEPAVQAQPVFSPQIAVPAPIVVTKESAIPLPKADAKSKKKGTPKTSKIEKSTKPQKAAATALGPAQKAVAPAAKPADVSTRAQPAKVSRKPGQKADVKKDLTEERRNKGFFKGFGKTLTKVFSRSDDKKAGALAEKDDIKETGMLALLGPIAPALQEIKELTGDRDEDEPSRLSKMIGVFKKEKPDGAEAEKKLGEKRDVKGRFIKKGATPAVKAESPVVEKLDIIHADLVSGDKSEEKQNKKQIRAIRGIEVSGGGFGGLGGKLKSLVPLLGKFAIALGPVILALNAITGWSDKRLQKKAFGLQEGEEATQRQKTAAASASIIDVGGVATGAASYFKGEEVTRADLTEGIYKLSSKLNTFTRDYDEELKGAQLEKYGADIQKGIVTPYDQTPYEDVYSARDYGYSAITPVAVPAKKAPPKNMMGGIPLSGYSASDYGYSAISDLSTKGTLGTRGKKARKMPISEDRTLRVIRQEKDFQKKTNASNEELLSESKTTNALLKKLVEKENTSSVAKERLSNGVINQSDTWAVMGVD